MPSRLLAVRGAAENNEEASHWLPRLQKKAGNSLAVLLCTLYKGKNKELFVSLYLSIVLYYALYIDRTIS